MPTAQVRRVAHWQVKSPGASHVFKLPVTQAGTVTTRESRRRLVIMCRVWPPQPVANRPGAADSTCGRVLRYRALRLGYRLLRVQLAGILRRRDTSALRLGRSESDTGHPGTRIPAAPSRSGEDLDDVLAALGDVRDGPRARVAAGVVLLALAALPGG